MITRAEKWRIRVLLVALGILAVVLVVILLGYMLEDRARAAESTPLRLIPNTDVNPFGANFFLQWEAEPFKREKTVEMAAQAGIGWAKQQFPWDDIEPAPGEYRWEKYDDIVDRYRRYGLQVIARLDRPPNWTRADTRFPERPPDNFEVYGDFVEAFVRHFQGRIRYIQVWNEPNIFPEWGDQPVDPAAYTRLLSIAYQRAKAVDPNIYVLSAPLAITTEDFPARRNLSDLIFLEEMYEAGAADYFDILAANAFGMDRLPTDPPDPDTLNFRRVELQREVMVRYGDADKPIWFNEYGWNAAPANFPEDRLIWQRVTEEQQATWTVEGIWWAREHWPWAGVFNVWYFRQIGNLAPDRADYYFRMVDVDFTPRRVYRAVQVAAREIGVAQAGYHQETSPAVDYDDNWQPRIRQEASAEADVVSDTPGAQMTLTFVGNGVDFVAARSPQAGTVAVSLDGRSVAGLERDEAGRSVVALHSQTASWQWQGVIARDLPAGSHQLRLELLTGQAAIDGFVVAPQDAPAFPVLPVGICAAGLAAGTWLLYRDLVRVTDRLAR